MYESPITQIVSDMQMEYENGVLKAVQNVGFHVNKEELAKALAYDRGQYERGYEDGFNADKWIPCSERLPALHDNVLVCTIDGGRTIAYLRMKPNHIFIERIFEDMYGTPIHEVIAWQPLPAPYYQKGE